MSVGMRSHMLEKKLFLGMFLKWEPRWEKIKEKQNRMIGSKNLRCQWTENQKLDCVIHRALRVLPCLFTNMLQMSRVWTRCPQEVPSNLKCYMTHATRVTDYQDIFQTLKSWTHSWSQLPGAPVTDVETHTVNQGQKRKTGLVRDLSYKLLRNKVIIRGRENKSRKKGRMFHTKNPLN